MKFTKNAPPPLLPGEDYVELFFRLDPAIEMENFGHENSRGMYILDGKKYVVGIVKDANSDMTSLVEVSGFYEGDTFEGIELDGIPISVFMEELAKIGSSPVRTESTVWWTEEKITFHVYEEEPRTIGWWLDDISDHPDLKQFEQ